jgi:hypothetical protein
MAMKADENRGVESVIGERSAASIAAQYQWREKYEMAKMKPKIESKSDGGGSVWQAKVKWHGSGVMGQWRQAKKSEEENEMKNGVNDENIGEK